MSDGKTVGDGISRVADVANNAGSGIVQVADKLVDEMKNLLTALGEKADQAIGPATNIVTTLMTQYVEEQKATVYGYMLTAIGCLTVAITALVGEACLAVYGAPYIGTVINRVDTDGNAYTMHHGPVVIVSLITVGIIILAFTVAAYDAWSTALNKKSEMTSNSVDKLIYQFSKIRGGR